MSESVMHNTDVPREALERLIKEVQTEHRAKRKPRARYAGTMSAANRVRKYRDAQYVWHCGNWIRKLTDRELTEFREGIERAMNPAKPIRLAIK